MRGSGARLHVGSVPPPSPTPAGRHPAPHWPVLSIGPEEQARCRYPENYYGGWDGVCPGPCTTNSGGCPSNSTLSIQEARPGELAAPSAASLAVALAQLWEPQLPRL